MTARSQVTLLKNQPATGTNRPSGESSPRVRHLQLCCWESDRGNPSAALGPANLTPTDFQPSCCIVGSRTSRFLGCGPRALVFGSHNTLAAIVVGVGW